MFQASGRAECLDARDHHGLAEGVEPDGEPGSGQASRGAEATTELAAAPRPVVASKCHESGCINGQCSPFGNVSAPHEGRSKGAKTSR
jgi:hypothetical protein